jgi:hypothetical protein
LTAKKKGVLHDRSKATDFDCHWHNWNIPDWQDKILEAENWKIKTGVAI